MLFVISQTGNHNCKEKKEGDQFEAKLLVAQISRSQMRIIKANLVLMQTRYSTGVKRESRKKKKKSYRTASRATKGGKEC